MIEFPIPINIVRISKRAIGSNEGQTMRDLPDIGPVFLASFPGECADCGYDFEPGTEVRYVDGELYEVDCVPTDLPTWGSSLRKVERKAEG
jgi:hypothetical protein